MSTQISKVGLTLPKLSATKDLIFERIVDRNGTVQILTPEMVGYVKQVEITVIFTREAYNNQSLLLQKGYFKQVLTISIESTKANRYNFLYYDPKIMSNICLRCFSPQDYTTTISLSKPKENESRLYEIKFGKAVRISETVARQLIISKLAIGFDAENLNEVCVLNEKY